jgi:ubiquinone/menaquinone biosynthesis C-methylase UbiE
MKIPFLKMLPISEYVGVNQDDPIRFYSLPIIGSLYRRRIELCLAELQGGNRILEIGFGSGVAFLNLADLYGEIFGLDLTASVEEVHNFFQEKGLDTYLSNGDILDMPYPDDHFDAVLAISILEHLSPPDQIIAFNEIARVLKPGGQCVYGVPVERPLMKFFFLLLGYQIGQHHFSTEKDIYLVAKGVLKEQRVVDMPGPLGVPREIYQVGHFIKHAE